MGRKANVYSRIDDAEVMIKKLCEKQPEALWAVKPDTIAVMGIENKERNEKNHTLAMIKPVKGAERAIFQLNNIPVRYIIVVYWSDYNEWNEKLRAAILFHELLHVHPDFDRLINHDIEDFGIILEKFGVGWQKKRDTLPNLLIDDVKFDMSLRPSVEEYDEENNDEISDEDKKKSKKEKKEEGKDGTIENGEKKE